MRHLLPALLFALALIAQPAAPALAQSTAKDDSDPAQQMELFRAVFEQVRREYVEPIENQKLVEDAMNGMLMSLDAHSGYMNAKDFSDMQIQTRGEFGGLGIEVTMENNLIKIIAPIDDTPAAKAGLQAGDLISHIDGKLVTEMTLNEAVDRMRGKPGTKVTLTIRRGSLAVEPFDVAIVRAVIKIVAVRSRIINDTGYIRITTFNEKTTSGVEKAIADINEKLGDKVNGYVIDLRNNPGGLLDQAIGVASIFLPDGNEVVSTRGRVEADNQKFYARGGDQLKGKPIVVLINNGSASASEIVAGAIQDYRRGMVLGIKSFGKGSVQTIIPVGNQGAIRMTTARYYTPAGRSIQATGIEPDITVEPAKLEVVKQDKLLHESDLRNALKNEKLETGTPEDNAKAAEKKIDSSIVKDDPTQDYQLMRAIDLLRGVSIYGRRSPAPATATAAKAETPAAAPAKAE